MRIRPTLCVWLALACPVFAASDWVAQGDAFDRQFKSAEALEAYQKAAAADPGNAEIERKIAKQYVELVIDAPSRKEKLRLAQLGYDRANEAKRLDPADPEVRLTVAVAAARLAHYTSDPRRKLELSRVVLDETNEALRLRPSYALGWHFLGRWHFEMAQLNPLLRMLAEAIYGKMPPSSNDEAVRHLERAAKLAPGNALFHAELGRAYAVAGRTDDARRELEKALGMPRRNRDDAGAQERARQALKDL